MLEFFATIILTIGLVRLVWIDLHCLRLPDVLTLPLIAAGVVLSATTGTPQIWMSVTGGIAAYVLFWTVGTVYYQKTGIDGLGLGDAKLFAASGTWLGLTLLPHVLLISSLAGLLYALIMRKTAQQRIAFGPWLALGFWVIWITRNEGWFG